MSLEQPCELNSLDVALDIVGVEKASSENLQWKSTVDVIQFELCGWRFLNHFDIVSDPGTPYSCDTDSCEL